MSLTSSTKNIDLAKNPILVVNRSAEQSNYLKYLDHPIVPGQKLIVDKKQEHADGKKIDNNKYVRIKFPNGGWCIYELRHLMTVSQYKHQQQR